ncbi:hypothetical protein BC941DRAFT_457679 [Chlamydoabsidia padenii]|nr:hypothetical protein BC941DRAFT_457679 [Chlamydoabsidia padenii]
MAKFELLEKFRQTAARRFPLEGFVANNNNNNPNSTITATGASIVHQPSVEDLPILVSAKEKVDVKCAVVMYNVTSFVTRLEEVMNLHRVDVEREYKRFLPLILDRDKLKPGLWSLNGCMSSTTLPSRRWEVTLNDLEVDESTMAMMTFFFNFNNLPSHWRSKLSMMVKEDAASFIKKTTKEMASFAADLELSPSKFGAQVANSHKRRRTDEPRRRDGT